jgi:type I restriction enzyme S subunit
MSIPKLRFPEFEGRGEWEENLFQDVALIIMGASPASEAFNTESIGLPFMQGNADVKDGLSAPRVFTSQVTRECKKNDILLSVRAPVGAVAKSIHDACIGRGLSAIRKRSNHVQEFLYQWLLNFEPYWQRISQGGTFDAVNKDDVNSLKITIPSLPEQQKIADCLSSLDDLIAAHKRKLDALKTHKKGLMQQLFPAEGETVPRLRFPEFENAGEWEEKRLGAIVDVNPRKYSIDDSKKVSFVPMSAVSEDGCLVAPEIRQFSDVKKGYTYFLDNDVLVAKITPCYENGKTALVSRLTNGYGAGSTEFHVFRSTDQILPQFLFKYLNTELVRNNGISSMVGSGGQQRVPASYFENLIALFPLKTEQQKIADCLSSLDDLIAAQAQRIEALKTHKKGLMQQLFPAGEKI